MTRPSSGVSRRAVVGIAAAFLCALASCSSPIGLEHDDYGHRVEPQRLKTARSLPLAEREIPKEDAPLPQTAQEPYAGAEWLEITIEQGRTWTLQNNLDLQVISPNSTTYYPWTLDPKRPSADAVRTRKNAVDNVERVDVFTSEVTDDEEWQVRIIPTEVSKNQPFTVVIKGIAVNN